MLKYPTRLKYKKGISPSISVNRDVKQGDLMSPLLFNSVIDYATSDLRSYNSIVNYMAFDDDLIIFLKDELVFKPK